MSRRRPIRSRDVRPETGGSDRNDARPAAKNLESFQFGKQNLLLESAIREIFSEPGKFNPLVLHGPVGCGKTHLATAIVARARQTRRFRRCVNITAEQFTSSFIDALQNRRLTDFRAKFRNLDLLAMDDLQFLAGKQATVIEFQNTLEALLRGGRQIVVTADRPVMDLPFADESLCTRLSSGLACPVRYPDKSGRLRILQQLADQRKLGLSPAVAELVASNIARDVRFLSGAVNRLQAAALVQQEPVDVELAAELLGDLFHSQVAVVSLARIEQAVCDVCGVEPSELKSNKRIKRISMARMLAMWLSRKYTSAGLAEIGKYYGGRSHSTVVAAQKKINGLLESDAAIDLRTRTTSVSSAVGHLKRSLEVG
jgi:chromosomal replication initiator protein